METLEQKEKTYSLTGGAIFKANPEKVLAIPYEASGRFGSVTKYKPKEGISIADTLKEISTPEFVSGGAIIMTAGKTVISPDFETIPNQDIESIISKVSEQTIKSIAKRKKDKFVSWDEPEQKEILSFQEVLTQYNPNLTIDEIKVFLWYMHSTGNTFKGQWLNIYNPDTVSDMDESLMLMSWAKQGLAMYLHGKFYPKVIYLSENLYEKKEAFVKEKEEILSAYGSDIVDAQEKIINEAFAEIYNRRLKLDNPDETKRLKIKPFSEFAKSTMIGNWEIDSQSGEPSEFLVTISGSEKNYGEINWYSTKTYISAYKAGSQKRKELSLEDAFKYWLKHANNSPQLSHNLIWEDIFKYYLDKKSVKNIDPTVLAKKRAIAKEVGDKFFSKFLAEIILENDRVKIERLWNENFNSNLAVDYDKIPIGFSCAKTYPKKDAMEIKAEKREAVSFHTLNGSSLIAYGVGFGKTWSAIFAIAQELEAEHCTRAVIITPNQVYKQFMAELKGILPNRKVYDLYNMGEDYISQLYDENGVVQMVEKGSISMLTYQGFEKIGFNEQTQIEMIDQLKDAISMIQDMESMGTKKGEKTVLKEEGKFEGMIGKALARTTVNIEELGFDFICFDEAHALKKIFSQVKARASKEGEDSKGKKMYEITAGTPSSRGIKGYFMCSYIQMQNKGKNVLLLTATPFTNSPLEVYSMLSLVAYQYMKTINLANINDFFDNFCQMSYELIINSKLQPERKQIFKGFDNLVGLQKLIYKYMLYKEADKPDAKGNILTINRPNKYVLPYKGRLEKSVYISAKPEEFIDTVLPLSELQKSLMEQVIAYVEGKISYDELSKSRTVIESDLGDIDEDDMSESGVVLDEGSLDDDEKAGVRTLRGVNFARAIALSPYLYEFSGLGNISYKAYIETSPKLTYVLQCIASVKKYHEDKSEPVSGQIIYMDRGKKYFEYIKDYLVNVIGYKEHEVGIIRSGKEGSAKHKEATKNAFNGEYYDEALKIIKILPDEKRLKVLIGTGSIKEGMNLQRYGTVLYNCFVDWNPTDEIQLEGRMWRQGNTFANVRIVIPMMSDSMDIFMFQKLEEKTSRINSLWNYDGQTNVLPVEELDPKEQKMALVTNPRVIAELEVESQVTKIEEEIAGFEANIQKAHNISQFMDTREKFEKNLIKIISLIAPEKAGSSIEVMAKIFETALETGKVGEKRIKDIIPYDINRYDYQFLGYDRNLTKPWDYGRAKGSIAMLKKAKRDFLERYNIADNKEALEQYINGENAKITMAKNDKDHLGSAEYLDNRATEIEQERKEKKITFASVSERVKEFEKLNYLLSIKAEYKVPEIQAVTTKEIEQCPPMTADGQRDISPAAIRQLEHCLENIPQTKDMHLDEAGNYTPERQTFHNLLTNRLLQKTQCVGPQEQPIAIFTGGVPGSGKSTYLKKYAPFLTDENIFKIDADAIREELPEYQGWNSKATHQETRDIYTGLLNRLSEGDPCKYDILWDGTMNKAENYKPIIGKLRKLGYKIFCIYVSVPGEVSRERVLKRYQTHGGYVPMQVVNEAIEQGDKGFDVVKYLIDGYIKIDGLTGKELERGGENILENRQYFKKEAEGDEEELELAKAKANARKRRLRLLTL